MLNYVRYDYFFKIILDIKILRIILIKYWVNVYRNIFVYELEFIVLVFVLFKLKVLIERDIFLIFCVENCNCKIEVENFLLMVEMGSVEFVEEFVVILKGFGYCDIVELIDFFGFFFFVGKYKIMIFIF